MPKLFRAMRKADDDLPVVDATGKGLGVRGIPVNGVADVDLDEIGRVILNAKGMSVAPQWRDLPYFLIPKRLQAIFPGAKGSSATYCFTMGEGAFADGVVSDDLNLIVDAPKHGVIIPLTLVSLDDFQNALAATRANWMIDET